MRISCKRCLPSLKVQFTKNIALMIWQRKHGRKVWSWVQFAHFILGRCSEKYTVSFSSYLCRFSCRKSRAILLWIPPWVWAVDYKWLYVWHCTPQQNKCEVYLMNGCRDNVGTDRQTDRQTDSNHNTIYDPGKNFCSGNLAPNTDQVRGSHQKKKRKKKKNISIRSDWNC